MSQETTNVEILKEAYRRWNDTRGGSVDHFFSFVDDKISFGSVPRGAAPLEFATQYNSKNELRGYFDALLQDWAMVYYRIDEYARILQVFSNQECFFVITYVDR